MTQHPRRPAAGTTLVEALITFLVLSLGLLAVSRVQGQLRWAAETARQRSEAVRLAEEDIEQLRAYARIAPVPGVTGRSYADVVTARRLIDAASGQPGNTAFRLSRDVGPSTVSSARDVSVTVDWPDRAGQLQTVRLETILAASDPALTGALGIAPTAGTVNGPMGRSAQIPRAARDLGDGRSAFTPDSPTGGTPTFLLDNATGAVVGRCPGGSGAASNISSANLGACTLINAYLLSGVVRFATGARVDQFEPVRQASVVLQLSGGSQAAAPECSTTSVSAADGDRYLQYVCIVYPAANGRWSGETRLVPDGWTFGGSGASGLRVCNEDGATAGAGTSTSTGTGTSSGTGAAATAAVGRLARYIGVSGTLAQQNFRVVRADLACPA